MHFYCAFLPVFCVFIIFFYTLSVIDYFNMFSSAVFACTLAVHMYVLSQEGLHTDQAFATAVILLVMVLLINILSSVIAKKMQRD